MSSFENLSVPWTDVFNLLYMVSLTEAPLK